jgi:hypothetical protein
MALHELFDLSIGRCRFAFKISEMCNCCFNHFEICRKATVVLLLNMCKDSCFLDRRKDPVLTSISASLCDVVYSLVQHCLVNAKKLANLGKGDRFGFGFLDIIPAMIVLDGNCNDFITLSSRKIHS